MNSVTQATTHNQNSEILTSRARTTVLKRLVFHFWELLREKDPPHKIALGLALGIFIGFLPIMGIQMAVVSLLVLPLRGNLKAALAGVWVSNPVTVVPLYWANYLFGTLFVSERKVSLKEFGAQMVHAANFDLSSIKASLASLFNLGADVVVPLWVGSTILAILLGILTYFAAYGWIQYYRRRSAERRN